MNTYEYTVVRYAPRRSTGEQLNIGVILRWPDGRIDSKFEERYGRLAETFKGTDGDGYRSLIRRFKHALDRISQDKPTLIPHEHASLQQCMQYVLPDNGLSVFYSPIIHGVSLHPEHELACLFDELVAVDAPQPEQRARRDDAEVFKSVDTALTPVLRAHLTEYTLEVQGLEVRFRHAYRNGKVHVIEPISLDYADVGQMTERVEKAVGRGLMADRDDQIGSLTYVIGKARLENVARHAEEATTLLHDARKQSVLREENAAALVDRMERDLAHL